MIQSTASERVATVVDADVCSDRVRSYLSSHNAMTERMATKSPGSKPAQEVHAQVGWVRVFVCVQFLEPFDASPLQSMQTRVSMLHYGQITSLTPIF